MQVDAASNASPSAALPVYKNDSSGESSNPEKWFEKSNNNVKANSTFFVDGESPDASFVSANA
jgi:hypothetical protein